ncbi:methyl-accepting chemotaxis protein [Desulfocurvibacter africanus PCS]|uniref:Methyl-accepting chemotaxis protein n=1 Tax=Desulfocurvibacter africanus PCS TaxID=1262666 RepID=M5PW00_DESAF|nr:methyl-accepting chemotaxis protein [Desulfocurvibacter africanus]EMG38175.1 methyl-accepting chemotaxis protein [Desulfocurvibacter africanus PCS]
MLDYIRHHLNVRISLLISSISIVVFICLIFVTTFLQRDGMVDQLDASVTRASELIRMAVEKPMVVGDDEGTNAEFAFLAAKYPDVRVHLTNYKGNVTYSTDKSILRKDLVTVHAAPELAEMIQTSLKEPLEQGRLLTLEGRDWFARTMSIPNEPACHHCHGASEPILGELVVMQDVSSTMSTIKANALETAAISLAGLAVLIGAVLYFIQRVVIRPLQSINSAAHRVAEGDFAASFDIRNSDELGQLSNNLASMVAKLKEQLGFSKGILSGMTLPCLVADTRERLTFATPAALKLVGRKGKPEDYLGMVIGEFFHNDSKRQTTTARALREKKAIQNHSLEFTNLAGEKKYARADVAPLLDLDGKLIGAFTLYSDLTDIRSQQLLIEKQNERIATAAQQADSVADQVSSASEELAAQIEQSSHGADSQQNMTGEAATAMEQMNASVLEVAKTASRASELAERTKDKAQQGEDVVEQAMALINRVAGQTDGLKKDMTDLGQQAEGIGKIITVIEDIADQTNLLALNAAIEAARAGEAGRGFAVVADEVRKLAEKTMAATREVGDYIASIQESTRKSVHNTEEAVAAIALSAEKANLSGQALHEIVRMIEETADQVRSIATASEEQSAASEQINRSTESINRIASETASAMNQSASAIQDLARLAHDLKHIIGEMQTS